MLVSDDAEETKSYYETAAQLLAGGKYEEALDQLEQVIRHDPDDAIAYSNKAMILLPLQRYEEALTACEQAIRINPGDAITYVNKSAALMHLQRYEEVVTACDEATRLDPNAAATDPGVYINKYLALLILGREAEAAQLYALIEQHPKTKERLLRLILAMMKGEASFKRL
jgi:tetratricopeptide (TPR) repeat protein